MIIKEKHQKLESLLNSYANINKMLDKWKENHPGYTEEIIVTIGDEKKFILHTIEVICKKEL
jgi:hypothetical protein